MLRSAVFASLFVGLAFAQPLLAQGVPAAGNPGTKLSPQALQALVSGIALYPDPIVTQILDAAQYPADIQMAATGRGSQQPASNSQLPASIVALQEYPDVLANLNQHLQVTTQLGWAYQSQPQDVWAAIDAVRASVDQNAGAQQQPANNTAPATSYPNTATGGYPAAAAYPVPVGGYPGVGYPGVGYPGIGYPGVGYAGGAGYLAASNVTANRLYHPTTVNELNAYGYGRNGAFGAFGRPGGFGQPGAYGRAGEFGRPGVNTPYNGNAAEAALARPNGNPAAAAGVVNNNVAGYGYRNGAAAADGQRTAIEGDRQPAAGEASRWARPGGSTGRYANVNSQQMSLATQAHSQNWGQLNRQMGGQRTSETRGEDGRQFDNRSEERTPGENPGGRGEPGRGGRGRR